MKLQIDLRRQLMIQGVLMLFAFLAHTWLKRTGIGKYTKPDPSPFELFNMTLQVSTTTGMSSCVPDNTPSQAVTAVHTLMIFLVLAL